MSFVIQILELFAVGWPHTDIMRKTLTKFSSSTKQRPGNLDGNLLDLDFAAGRLVAKEKLNIVS